VINIDILLSEIRYCNVTFRIHVVGSWVMTPCSDVVDYQCFRGGHYILLIAIFYLQRTEMKTAYFCKDLIS